MAAILFIVGILIIVVNLAINFGSMSKVVRFCIKHNSLRNFWSLYYKHCVHMQAIYSTIISFIFALILFVLLIPVVLIMGILFKNKIREYRNSGLYFYYNNSFKSQHTSIFYTNVEELGIEKFEAKCTGDFATDLADIVVKLRNKCTQADNLFLYDVMQEIELRDSKIATVPLLTNVARVSYPVYILYTLHHAEQYKRIKQTLQNNGIEKIVYFSLQPVQ